MDAGGREPRIAGVLLAAGRSARMGRPKATLAWRDETFVAATVRALHDAGCAPLLVVCGPHAVETRASIPSDLPVTAVDNPAPERGQLSSLKVALAWLELRADVLAAAVSLVDHPAVSGETIRLLCARATPGRIVVPTHHGRRGHPVVFGRGLFAELLSTSDSLGARAVVRRDPGRVTEIETDDPEILRDVDTPEDLADLRRRGST